MNLPEQFVKDVFGRELRQHQLLFFQLEDKVGLAGQDKKEAGSLSADTGSPTHPAT